MTKNVKASFAYVFLWFSGLLILLVEQNDKFVRFHAMQSTIFFGGLTVVAFLFTRIPTFGWLIDLLVIPMIGVISWIILIWKSYKGEKYKLPVIGFLAEKQLKCMTVK